ncbi:uncharacterized protein FOMMEDRAFT_163479 [Fomitiporia mediterranea MF3/22]|uniref:Uncharacterized protein n=1 Tax=Fomitiporia mediterranea (strain MF3/22) TaxID=694068 RepID=R7SFD6_FOMME|nr:uncharacterized protein FOMMEDRAFT_163479 [Fomitiporia mediterranea MF3/22]EJC97418.1 hypothetical protein FOMMEDRAFT_163479 [Fomitiporia mediterranea MF3/22]
MQANNAEIVGMKSVTLEMIAYICVQVFSSSGELLTIEPEKDKESSIAAILRAQKACKGCGQS